jgi:hypothetical protein
MNIYLSIKKMNKIEKWLDITWYEDKYQISNFGRVKALNYKNSWREQVLKLSKNTSWYLIIGLHFLWKRNSFLVHRLVMQEFDSFSSKEINHIDWNPLNNVLENLEYCTRSYNLKHSFRELWRQQVTPMIWRFWESHPKSIKIDMLSENFQYIRTWNWVRQVARALNIAPTGISKVLKWKQKTAWWFIFKYSK